MHNKRAYFLNLGQHLDLFLVIHLTLAPPTTYIISTMTIHTKWMELLREEASDAFHRELGAGVVEASFIDGQIKLMKGDSILTWYCLQV